MNAATMDAQSAAYRLRRRPLARAFRRRAATPSARRRRCGPILAPAALFIAAVASTAAAFTPPAKPTPTFARSFLTSSRVADSAPSRRSSMSIHMSAGNDGGATSAGESFSSPSPSMFDGARYLGSGTDAIIRPGVVLVAPAHEFDHFLMRSAVFIFAIGLDEREETVARAVILDHPTAFTIGEMSPNVMGTLSQNLLFRGGRTGKNTAMLLHSGGDSSDGGPVSRTSGSEIGSSGIYEGGIVEAMEASDAGLMAVDRCKFFFNYMEFGEDELDEMFLATEDGDGWVSLEVPADWVLESDLDRGELWMKLRKYIRDGGYLAIDEE